LSASQTLGQIASPWDGSSCSPSLAHTRNRSYKLPKRLSETVASLHPAKIGVKLTKLPLKKESSWY
jgi:S-adenosylhomocysteine hydrolase